MKMKKITGIISIIAVMVLVLAGCGSENGGSSDSDTPENGSTSGGSYVIATDTSFAPFGFTDEEGKASGIDIDILDAIAQDQGFSYELRTVGTDEAVNTLASGDADGAIAKLSITEERQKSCDFSDAYYEAGVCAAVKSGSAVSGIDDIRDNAVAVTKDTDGAAWAESINDQYNLDIQTYDDREEMYDSVIKGDTVACFDDYPVMAYNILQDDEMKILERENDSYTTSYGFAVKKGTNSDLLDKFNKGLANIKENGKYEKIIKKYVGKL